MQKQNNVEVSVIIPTYNRSSFVTAAIESVLRQKWGAVDDSYELIIVNDGSIDNTQCIIDSYCKAHPTHLKSIQHEMNKGIAWTLNTGFRAASG